MEKQYRWLFTALFFITLGGAYAQGVDVNLTAAGDNFGDSYLQKHVTAPLAQNLGMVVQFVYAICAFTALIGGLRIYVRIQTGETDAFRAVWQWGAAILTVLGLTTGLGYLLENQTYGRGVTISSQNLQAVSTNSADLSGSSSK